MWAPGETELCTVKKGMPQDIRISPDGKRFYIADMHADGVHIVDGASFTKVGFIATGLGAHGLYPSRDGTQLYVANRGSHKIHGARNGNGSVTVIDFASEKIVARWGNPGGGSPDMGNVSADGKWLWLAARYDDVIYRFDTTSGAEVQGIGGGSPPAPWHWAPAFLADGQTPLGLPEIPAPDHLNVGWLSEGRARADVPTGVTVDLGESIPVDAVRLLLEADAPGPVAGSGALAEVLRIDVQGAVDGYLTQGRATPARQATLRQIQNASVLVYGEKADWLRSEACLKLDLGPDRAPGLLLLASEDPHMFGPQQGTDLLIFFAGVAERIMRRWLP